MDTANEDLYGQKLDELIYDEDKIVTGPSLALHFKIPVHEAKTLITKYIPDHRQVKPHDLAVTYVLSGTLKDSKGLSFCLVKESELGMKRDLFETVTAEVVYSIQKSENIDYTAIAMVNDIADETNTESMLGVPISKNCIKRNMKVKKLPPPPPPKSIVKEKPSLFAKIPPKTENKSEEKQTAVKESNPTNQIKSQKPKPSGGIANFFTRGAPKQNGIAKEKAATLKDDIESTQNTTKQTNITDTNEDIIESSFLEEPMEVQEEVKPAEKSKSEKTKKRKKENKTNDAPTKRRKRIQQICDSDSDDMFENDENDVIEKSDGEPEPPPMMKSPIAPKNKIRKAVDKTYMDEEGYIVTKTEYVFETAPEVEKEEVAIKKEEKSKLPFEKKNSTTDSENEVKSGPGKGKKNQKQKKPTSGKQPTLMSWFKKT